MQLDNITQQYNCLLIVKKYKDDFQELKSLKKKLVLSTSQNDNN